jgi:hypothetical protein
LAGSVGASAQIVSPARVALRIGATLSPEVVKSRTSGTSRIQPIAPAVS